MTRTENDMSIHDRPAWEERYSSHSEVWSGRPNEAFVAEVTDLPAGTALDVACGEGADACWLAGRGWRVTAVDFSTVALGRAEAAAADAGVTVDWVHADLRTWVPTGTFDLVSAQYMHVPSAGRDALHVRLAAAVAPGGTLLIVAHDPSDLETSMARHRDPDMFATADEVAATLDPVAWEVLVAEARPRPATDPDGREITIRDAVLRARRRRATLDLDLVNLPDGSADVGTCTKGRSVAAGAFGRGGPEASSTITVANGRLTAASGLRRWCTHGRGRTRGAVRMDDNTRRVEDGLVRDFRVNLSYGRYLHLDELLAAQHPVSVPPHHDELLFVIQHQTSELWLKLVLHELLFARECLAADDPRPALKSLARVKHIQRSLTEQWSVLATLTPTEYAQFRRFLGTSSGFQSYQYRAVEFVLGNKDARLLEFFADDDGARTLLAGLLAEPSVYDEFPALPSARHGHDVPADVLERDVRLAHTFTPGLVPTFRRIYEDPRGHWEAYEACEELVDLEENFQLWRFRHLKTVERVIGVRPGTGGSSGVPFLRAALDLTFFPELYAVRGEIGIR